MTTLPAPERAARTTGDTARTGAPPTGAPTRPISAPAGGDATFTGGGLPGAIASEWTKLWSVRTTWWGLLASVLLMAAAAGQLAIYVANANTNTDPTDDTGPVTVGTVLIDAVELVQFGVLAVALIAITSEYANGTIRTTLACTPSRGRMLLAKAVVVAVVTFGAGLLTGAVGVAVARPVLGDWGLLPVGDTIGDLFAVATYLALFSVATLGLGAALRGVALTLTVIFLTVLVIPLSLQEPDLPVLNRIADGFPSVAGGHFMSGDTGPYPAPVGLALLAGWAGAALVAGVVALRRRDA